jgi:hypothetical protein
MEKNNKKMKAYNKKAEAVVIEANGVDKERWVVQFNSNAPHIRLYERKKRGDVIVHAKVNEFYNMKKTVQCAYVLSNKSE